MWKQEIVQDMGELKRKYYYTGNEEVCDEGRWGRKVGKAAE